jgi:hypothetical protein
MVYASGVPRKTRRSAIILEIKPRKYAVAVWRREEGGEPV